MKAGCENPGYSQHVPVKGGKVQAKKTWTPAEAKNGYSVKATPKLTPAKVGLNTGGSKGGKQKVK